jgi:hypothetical protein
MASTRNRNTPGDYKAEQKSYKSTLDYLTHKQYGRPPISYLPGDGLLPASTCRNILANNACDIESNLFGIGSTNLVKPTKGVVPELRELKSLNVMDKPTLFVNEPRIPDKNQRPMILN